MDEITHHIEKYIIKVLAYAPSARFSQMRPPRTDSNLYSYHLNKLLKLRYIVKKDREYSLSPKGLEYADRLSMRFMKPVLQPKITTGVLVKNEFNEIILIKRGKQPFLNRWSLPLGKTYIDDRSVSRAAERELLEKTGVLARDLKHVGDCYVRVSVDGYQISNIFAHIFYIEVRKADIELSEASSWVRPDNFDPAKAVPGAREIVDLALHHRGHFFKELYFEV
ncbi:MAG: NUDIX hydrolase [Candidatus Nomurabacteria bacterium]|jgi:ADP-ribose pyrophosphatase YjhB (NUDIX family)|nr:NUDIX hydrolase [Candidatus Nomurabacteria bacterium]